MLLHYCILIALRETLIAHHSSFFFFGLNMHSVPVIWTRFDFRPCKKKIEIHPCNFFFCLKKVPDPTTIQLIWNGFGHVAVADFATFATWRAT